MCLCVYLDNIQQCSEITPSDAWRTKSADENQNSVGCMKDKYVHLYPITVGHLSNLEFIFILS